jgi:hypothetical protein
MTATTLIWKEQVRDGQPMYYTANGQFGFYGVALESKGWMLMCFYADEWQRGPFPSADDAKATAQSNENINAYLGRLDPDKRKKVLGEIALSYAAIEELANPHRNFPPELERRCQDWERRALEADARGITAGSDEGLRDEFAVLIQEIIARRSLH